MAEEEELDLVLMSPSAVPPVCKIMDYGKYRFDSIKKEKESRKKQKVAEIKEMQLSLSIQENDINIKAKKVKGFLQDGDKVKVALRLRGRELGNSQAAIPVMQRFFEKVESDAIQTSPPQMNGRQVIMVLAPKNTK